MQAWAKISWSTAKAQGITRKQWCAALAAHRVRRYRLGTTAKKPEARRTFPLPVWPCVHRGESIGETTCKSCGGGRVALKIFTCATHGECTVDRLGDKIGVPACKVCKDRKAP